MAKPEKRKSVGDVALPPRALDAELLRELHDGLLAWYREQKRDLPWRRTRDPYAIWVSEVMLQQTRVETVIPYYERFLARFPTPLALAEAPTDDVLALWSGLGYYRRARLLQRGAASLAGGGGALPTTRGRLRDVPGIGPYTAGAIASIAFGEPVGLVDGNVARVLARVFVLEDDMRGVGMKRAQVLADHLVARDDPGAWNQALMELGATVCTPRSPSCDACPLALRCGARAAGRQASLPVLSAKAKPTESHVEAVVARLGDAVLLGRRAGDRLFGGMWEPPLAEVAPERAHPLLRAEAGLALAGTPERAGTVVHVLSHRRMTIDVIRVPLATPPTPSPASIPGYDAFRMVPRDDLGTLGVSTLARKVLTRAEAEPLFAAARAADTARKAGR